MCKQRLKCDAEFSLLDTKLWALHQSIERIEVEEPNYPEFSFNIHKTSHIWSFKKKKERKRTASTMIKKKTLMTCASLYQ